jgi:CxxC motif-containing protein (DUF1111 family)
MKAMSPLPATPPTSGQYGDATPYSLQKPNYSFSATTPTFFSARIAPQLVGLGLLEAVSESTIQALADPDDANADGVSGRMQTVLDPETAQQRLGRFGAKAGRVRVSHQVAGALNTDMGVTTAIFPKLDGETTNSPVELSAADLDLDDPLCGVARCRRAARSDQCSGVARRAVVRHRPMREVPHAHADHEPVSSDDRVAQSDHPSVHGSCLLHDMGPGLADNMSEGNGHRFGMAHAAALEHRP